ncbi:MAG: cytochrome c-type biosis protein CcmE [Solirubrobacteraceae bacterium]|jgi:cytochrome c-type biogenesis protein CcmE|nr:cytochrome c-type biosis protein CcmE [Solirubrobacteraceae bacterium]
MDPARKRTIRLTVSLTAAVLLATALVYTSFTASSETKTPSQLLASAPTPGQTYDVTGKVADGTWRHEGTLNTFSVRDRNGSAAVPVRYNGPVPDPFREGREVVVTVKKEGNVYVASKLITKCPSKFVTSTPVPST